MSFSAAPDPTNNIPVDVHVTQTGDFISEALSDQGFLRKAVTIPNSEPNTGRTQFTVRLSEDNLDEADGTITAVIQDGSGYTLGDQSKTITVRIQDNDPLPELTIADATPSNEGNGSNNGMVEFTPTLSVVSGRDVIVSYYTAPSGTNPVAADDYSAVPQANPLMITIPAGKTTPVNDDDSVKNIVIMTTADDYFETDETFTLNFSADFAGVAGGTTATGTILNDDSTPTLSIADAEGIETDTGTGTVVFDVTLMPAASEVVTVFYFTLSIASEGHTATSGDDTPTGDFVAIFDSLRFEIGETRKQITIETNGDDLDEVDETFSVGLVTATNATISRREAMGTILSDDNLVFAITDASIEEGDDASNPEQLEFTVTLSSGATEAKSIKYRTINGTAIAGEDFTAPTEPDNVRNFAIGEKSKTIRIPILSDRNYESDETFTLQLYENSAGTQILTSDATGTIENDDPEAPLVSITGGLAVNEGGQARFNLSFPEYQANAIDVRVQFSDDNGGFLDPNRNRIQTFSFFETKSITEQTLINYNTDTSGTITATILPDDAIPATYAYGSQRSAQVTINNLVFNNLVSLDDAIENTGVTRGHNFIITANINQTQSMYTSIPYTIENVGNRAPSLSTTSGFIIIQAGTLSGTKSISVDQFHPTNIAADAAYRVSIQKNPSSVYTLNTQASEITIPVRENSQPTAARPVVSITPTTPRDVIAGSPVSFTVTATPAPTSDLSVKVLVTTAGNFIVPNLASNQPVVSLTNANPSDMFEITGNLTGITGTVTATIEQGDGYILPIIETNLSLRTIASEVENLSTQATVIVEEAHAISVSTNNSTIDEGQSFTLNFSAQPRLTSDTTINIRVTEEGGSFLLPNARNRTSFVFQILEVRNPGRTAAVVFGTYPINDNIDANGLVKVEILDGAGYQIGATASQSVTIEEKSEASIFIRPVTRSIIKGETARFEVSSDFSSSSARTFIAGISTIPTNLIAGQATKEVTIDAGVKTAEFTINTTADSDTSYERNGFITAEIELAQNSVLQANVEVIDDDVPTGISILNDSGVINEGETAEFIIMASDVTATDRTIGIRVTDGDTDTINPYDPNYPYREITIPKILSLLDYGSLLLKKPKAFQMS